VDHTRAQATPASNPTSQVGEPSQDEMWHLMQQLSMMLKQNSSKNFDIIVNLTSKFSQ